MRILALDAALARCSAAVLDGQAVLAERQLAGGRGHAALLAPMVAAVLAESGLVASALAGVAVTVGPGSFTGLRVAIALAQGIAAASGIPVIGVTVAEALAEAVGTADRRTLWVAIDSRRGRIFLDHDGVLEGLGLDALPSPAGPVAVAGDAAIEVAGRLLAWDFNVRLTDARLPLARHVGAVGARRLAGALPALEALPIYVDPPEAKLPAGGLRPAPV